MRRAILITCSAFVASAAAAAPIDDLRRAFGADAFASPRIFEYRLVIRDAGGAVLDDARYQLDTASGAMHRATRDGETWFDGASGYGVDANGVRVLDASRESSLAAHAASNFARLFADPATRVEPQGDAFRVTPATGEGFTIKLDGKTGLIRENVFDDGTRVRETEYRNVDGLQWPIVFEIVRDGRVARRGEFSDAKLAAHHPLPVLDVATATAISLAAPEAGGALVSAGVVSTAANEYNLVTDAAGTVLVFARSAANFESARIMTAQRRSNDAAWSTPQPIAFTNERYSDSDPWLSPDGSTLYFVSNRPRPGDGDAPRKDTDIWRATRVDGEFGQPEWLGARINSDAMELGPEAHEGMLYFNSSRPGGPAGLSIYGARLDGDATPAALPGAINAGVMQGDFTISPDGRTALFWQQAKGGNADLHAATRDGDAWTQVERLPAPFSSPGFDFTPHFIDGGRAIAFASMRTTSIPATGVPVFNGQSNLYVARAPKR